MSDYEAQICVIAAGPSGLSAAVQAAEDGACVIVLEKASSVGGAANMGMGPLGIGTKYQKQQMIDLSVEKAFNMFMEYTHYQVDARLVKRYFEQSADTIEWLENMGVEFEGAFRYFPQSEATWHIVKSDMGIGPRAASFMNKALYNRALELGVTFLLETTAVKILKETDAVCGVMAVDKNGKEVHIDCKAVIICTGGAGANPEMIYDCTGFHFGQDLFNFAIPGITGDGIKMAWDAGAGKMPIRIEKAAIVEDVFDLPPCVPNVFTQPNLLVNQFGKRVMNEEYMQNSTYLANVVTNQKNRVCYSIIDTSIIKKYLRDGVDVISMVCTDTDISSFTDGMKMAVENKKPSFYVADTIEELALQMGIDSNTLIDTVNEYNDYCDSVDEEFFKSKKYLHAIYKGPYYAARIRTGGYGTVGGVRINENCEAIDDNFMPIPGLYCAGADSCNIYNDSYMFLLPGNSMGYAVNTGRIAGMQATEYVEQQKY